MFSSPRRILARSAVVVVVGAIVIATFPGQTQAASGDKTLKHIAGDTGYTNNPAGTNPTLVTGSQDLPDDAYVVTQNGGVADIVLRDSSVIRIAQNAKIKVAEFNSAESGRENFIVCYSGAYRFHIERPAGGRSNYRFITPTSQIAVRGTDGLIEADPDKTQVSTTIASSADDVRVAVNTQGVNFALYTPPLQSPWSDKLTVRAFNQDDLPPTAPDNDLVHPTAPVQVAQAFPPFPVTFTVVAQGTTAVVTGTITIVNGVISIAVVSGTLSTVTTIGTVTAAGASTAAAGAAIAGAGTLTAAGAAAVAAAVAAATTNTTASATASPSASAAPTLTPSPTPSPVPTATPTSAPTATPTSAPTATPSATPTATATPTRSASPSPTPTASASQAPTNPPTATPAPTASVQVIISSKQTAAPRVPLGGQAGPPRPGSHTP